MKVAFKYLRHIALCLFFLSILATAYAKKNGITVYGSYKVNGGGTDGVQIRLLRNGIKEGANSSGNGKFEYDLLFNNQYELQFSKSGYITKKVVISTDVPERVLETNNNFPPFKIEIELFREVEGGDYSIFDEPVAMVIYDKELDDFDYDHAYNAEIEEEIKEVEAKIVIAPIAPKVDESSRLYDELIKKADSEFDAKSYVDARKTYQKAQKIKPKESYPQVRIDLIDKILADLKKRENQKSKNDSYYALIDKADVLLDEKKYKQAHSYYVEASEIKPDQQYPKDKIKLIDQVFADREAEQRKYDNTVALADRYFQEKKYENAKTEYENALKMRKDETYPKEQIKRVKRLLGELQSEKERKQNYEEAIAKADALFDKKNWNEALASYEGALQIKPEASYPKNRIQIVNQKLKEEARSGDLQKRYDAVIAKADELFNSSQWLPAIAQYDKALDLKPQESYPKSQIDKIKAQISAKELAEAEALKAQKNAELQEAYDKAITTADKEFADKRYAFAKQGYRKALSILPNEQYPKDKLQEIDKLFQQQEEVKNRYYNVIETQAADSVRYYRRITPKEVETEQKEVKIIDATSPNETRYEELMQKAQSAEHAGNYQFAKAYYYQAYLEKPSPSLMRKLEELNSKTRVKITE